MKFGIFYELQLPKPWGADDERQLVQDALDQVELADRLGLDYAWAVEHHFLEEYSHCSASEVFLAAAAARTKRIRLGHGIRQVIPNYNHPARTAEAIAMLDLVSNGRAELGIGEGATRLELGGFEFFRFAISALVTNDCVPGRSKLFERFQQERAAGTLGSATANRESLASAFQRSRGIRTSADFRAHVHTFQDAGVDQIILLQQA